MTCPNEMKCEVCNREFVEGDVAYLRHNLVFPKTIKTITLCKECYDLQQVPEAVRSDE